MPDDYSSHFNSEFERLCGWKIIEDAGMCSRMMQKHTKEYLAYLGEQYVSRKRLPIVSKKLTSAKELTDGTVLLFFLLFVISFSDIFAYFGGKRFGKSMLAPTISPKKTWEGVRGFLDIVGGGKDGGSYGYTDSPGNRNSGKHAMNAVGFFCAQLTRSSANAAKAFESALILEGAGFQLADIYYAYYGTLAAYQHQGPVWRKWIKQMQAEYLKAQAPDGSWQLSGPHTGAMGQVIITSLVTLCLEAHYRYTPLYGLGFEPDPAGPSLDVIEGDALPATPIFRHAKHLPVLSSPNNDSAPVITDHGDFLYFFIK